MKRSKPGYKRLRCASAYATALGAATAGSTFNALEERSQDLGASRPKLVPEATSRPRSYTGVGRPFLSFWERPPGDGLALDSRSTRGPSRPSPGAFYSQEDLVNDTTATVEAELGPVCIVWLDTAPGPCACGADIGIGPVGFHLNPPGPVCDQCLLEMHKDVGMTMWMIHIARELANNATNVGDPLQADKYLVALMAFAKLYNLGATWPAREAAAMEFVQELQARMETIPWDALVKELAGPTQ